jgi:hypothetical protein
MELKPGKLIEQTIGEIEGIFEEITHWTCFGALWGLIRNEGTIPDGDLDVCVHYGASWKEISDKAAKYGYETKKVVVNDIDKDKALFMGLIKNEMYICLSFWYPFKDFLFWCHDQDNEVKNGVGIVSHYFFKGAPKWLFKSFVDVEWPGIRQDIKIRVPVMAGSILDLCYPRWFDLRQRYVIQNYTYQRDKCISVNDPAYIKGSPERATSRYTLNLNSMKEFENTEKINKQLEENAKKWDEALFNRKWK